MIHYLKKMEEKQKECIFCKIIKGEIPSEKVYEDDNFLAIKDIEPKVKGHTLLIPKKHFKTFLDVPNTLGNEMLDALKKTSLKLIQENQAESINLAVVGEDVAHYHLHILPRKKADGFSLLS